MKKKIIISVSLGIVAVLIATTLVLALVKKSYKPEFDLAPKTVTIVQELDDKEFESSASHSTSKKFEKIVNLFDESFKQSVLASIFSGNSSNKVEISLVSKLPTFSEGYTVTFDYKADMVLKKDGKDFIYGTNSDKQIKVQKIILNVVETNGFDQVFLYAKEVVGVNTYYYEITTTANFDSLYSYIGQCNFT